MTISKQKYLDGLETVEKALKKRLVSPENARNLVDSLRFEYLRTDVLAWAKYYLPDKCENDFSEELHGYFAEIAEEPFTVTLAPRNSAKTTIKCVVIPLFLALNYPEKFRYFLNIQSTSTKAIAINLSIRAELESNERLISDYGLQVSPEKWTEKMFVLRNGVIFGAIGSGESIRGLNYRNIRPDYVIGDDLYDDDCINNPDAVRKINAWWWSSVYKAVAAGRKVCFHIQGTAINRIDLMHELSTAPGVKFRKFQSVNLDTGWVLWPARHTVESLQEDALKMGSIIFNREMQNELRDDESSIIKLRDIIYYDGTLPPTKQKALEIQRFERLTEIPEHIVMVLGGVDPAEKEKEINDFTAKVGVAISNLGNYYVFDAREGKMSAHANKTEIVAWHQLYQFDKVRFETNKSFAVFQELQRTSNVPVQEVIATKDKMSHLIAHQAKFENHKVLISQQIDTRIRERLVEQIINNKPNHDDIRDALLLCLDVNIMSSQFDIFIC